MSCPASPCRFRQGERIPVDLTFSTDATVDLVGRGGYGILNLLNGYTDRFELGWNADAFTADPADGAIDPAGAHASGMTLAGSWNLGLDPLGKSAATVRLELNEWLYFETPGRYKVTATSKRVCPLNGSSRGWSPSTCLDVQSNPMEIEITAADPVWQRQQFERIVRELPNTLCCRAVRAQKAVRELTYLGTADALEEIQRRLEAGGSARDLAWHRAWMFLLLRTGRAPAR